MAAAFYLLRKGDARSSILRSLSCFFLLACSFPLHALGNGKPLHEYGQQTWQSDSGLPQNTVRAIAQTSDGYLWIGTESGLVRFDGIDFDVFDRTNTPALRSDVISSLQQDAAGSLWIGTAAGLVREHASVFTTYGRSQGLPSATVLSLYLNQHKQLLVLTSGGAATYGADRFIPLAGTERLGLTEGSSLVAEDPQGHVWIAGLEGVASTDSPTEALAAGNEVGEIQALAVTSSGEVWVGGSSGLTVLRGGHAGQPAARGSLPSNDVTSLWATSDSGMWIGTSKGLALWSHGVIKGVPELAGRRVQRLFEDRSGTLWVATSEGLARISHGKVDLDTRRPLLSGVLSIFEDREGSMWFGTETAGLRVLRDQAFSTITVDDGLTASLVRAVFEDHAGTMWIGTSGGGLDKITDGKVTQFKGLLPSKVILAMAETNIAAAHNLWVGTPEGLARIRGQDTRVFTTADGLPDDFVRSLYAERDGSLWIGTRNGLSHFENGKFRSYSRLDGLPSDLIGTILRRRDNTLCLGTLGGLSYMSGDTFVKIATPGGSADAAITAMLEDNQGRLWVGINDEGLSRVDGGILTPIEKAGLIATNLAGGKSLIAHLPESILPRTIYGMLEDQNGDLWLSSRTGVDRVSLAALDRYSREGGSLPVVHFGSADGMRISEASGGGHPAAWRAHDGGLWFATLDGAAVVHPRSGPRDSMPPLPAIEQVLIDDQEVSGTDKEGVIHIAPGHGRLAIRYAGLSFVAPQRVRYRYRLEGFDERWIEAGTRRTAFYTNVPPGSYRFRVLCANSDGVWSEQAAEQRFTFEPLFYQTGWFYAFLALAIASLAYLVYKWRVLTVEAQYQAVVEERSRIAREIHDTLAQGYVAVSVQLELAERLIPTSWEAALEQIRHTKDLVRDGLAEARSSIWNLRAHADAEALPSLLAAYAGSLARRHGCVIKFTVHGAYRPFERSVEGEVLRIAQQALANAVAHARATLITARISYDTQWLELTVADDGIGMPATEQDLVHRGHFGLQGMRERAASIGSLLEVENAPGQGVTIKLRIDLRSAGRKENRDREKV